MTNECGQEAEQRSGYGDKQVEQYRESLACERYIKYDLLKKLWVKVRECSYFWRRVGLRNIR